MYARIYQPSKTAMQSGRAKTSLWLLEFTPNSRREPDALMGWVSSGDTKAQVQLKFNSRDEAIAYARSQGLAFQVFESEAAPKILKAYADNFAFGRKQPWTH